MAKQSAGILLFRSRHKLQILLVHPGGPFWAKKDEGPWSIPKGEYDEAEDALAAAKRELREETGIVVAGEFLELGTFKQPSGHKFLNHFNGLGTFSLCGKTGNICLRAGNKSVPAGNRTEKSNWKRLCHIAK
ncbi:MAG: NUDIX domain-containing protein [Pseudomonadota bacterium]|nr:NUDIX domain-containing protein [Pseudomonadota bacterium]